MFIKSRSKGTIAVREEREVNVIVGVGARVQ